MAGYKGCDLRMLVTNAFGLQSKLGELQRIAKTQSPDIIIVTETKFTADKINQLEASLPGYSEPLRCDRTAQGGGVAVWVKSSLAVAHMDRPCCEGHEVVWLNVRNSNGKNTVICAIYRSGSLSDTDVSLFQYLDDQLAGTSCLDAGIILAGDFNVHHEAWLGSNKTTKAGEELENLCASYGLSQHVKSPTRGCNPLDLIMSDHAAPVSVTVNPPLGRSDHAVLIADFLCLGPHQEPATSRTSWCYHKADWPRLRHYFRSTDWSTVLGEDADTACEKLTSIVHQGMNRFVPSKSYVIRTTDPTWWNSTCAEALARKSAAWRRWRKHRANEFLKQAYVSSVQSCAAVFQAAMEGQRSRLRAKLTSGSISDKGWWTNIKKLGGIGRNSEIPLLVDQQGTEYVTSREKADCFGKHFSSKCSLGSADLSADSLPCFPQRPGTAQGINTIHFRTSAVCKLLSRIDISKAPGPDNIPARVLKECAQELAPAVTRLFRLIFRSGIQPAPWKLARVIPIHKRSSKAQVKNYRPVSLLPLLSKIYEAIVNNQLTNYLEKHCLLSPHQFGFRRKLGTADLLTALHYEWIGAVGSGGSARIIAIDIAGAFDRVSHEGLLHKASAYGIRGQLLTWLKSYLSNRQINVVIGGQQSQAYPITAGVPQGSILGPTLFLLYINDMEEQVPAEVGLAIYADDTTLYSVVKNPAECAHSHDQLQTAINAIQRWGQTWSVSFEPTKSQSLVVTNWASCDVSPVLFDNVEVQEEDTLKLLGVTFDRKLSFRTHLRHVSVRGNQRLYFLRKAARYLDSQSLMKVYRGFVRPILEYSPLVWMGAAPSHLARLDQVQKRAMKIAGSPVLLQSLAARRYVAGLCYLYKLQCLLEPKKLVQMVPPSASQTGSPRTRRQARPRHKYQLLNVLPTVATLPLRRSFPHCLLEVWNDLPESLLQQSPHLSHLQSFKLSVNEYLRRKDWLWATNYCG